jgi:dTDP-4-dehydrorhamnose 3,5-epimerase
MIFSRTPLEGSALIIDIEQHEDSRGFFARTVCRNEFNTHNLNSDFTQQSISFNPKVGTVRGMHWQTAPYAEDKLVRATRGAIFDVIVDIRPDSKTYRQWHAAELSERNRRQIYIPKGFAHGFQTLEPDTEVLYEMTTSFQPEASRGFIWNDPAINIEWPKTADRIIGVRDSELPRFTGPE